MQILNFMSFTLNTKDNINYVGAVIYILFVIALTWKLPLSNYIRWNQGFIFRWLVMLSLASYVTFKIDYWLGALFVWFIFSAYFPRPTPASGEALFYVIFGFILLILLNLIYNQTAIYTLICLFALANIFALIIQRTGFDFQHVPNWALMAGDKSIRIGLMENHNSLSAALAFCLPAFFESRWKWFIPLIFLGLIAAKTVGGVLAVIPTCVFYLNKWLSIKGVPVWLQGATAVVCAFIALSLYVKYIDGPNYKSRWSCWKMYGNLVADPAHNKIRGIGIGHWKIIFGRDDIKRRINDWAQHQSLYGRMYYMQAHNEAIQLDFETGKIGLGLAIVFLVAVLLKAHICTDPRSILALLGIIINSMVYFPFHVPFLAVIIILWLTIFTKNVHFLSLLSRFSPLVRFLPRKASVQ